MKKRLQKNGSRSGYDSFHIYRFDDVTFEPEDHTFFHTISDWGGESVKNKKGRD
jgi:hypothetical protein